VKNLFNRGNNKQLQNNVLLIILLILIITLTQFNSNSQAASEVVVDYDKLPAIVIMYDDGFMEDYTKAFPIHQEYDVPGMSAINTAHLGEEDRLNWEQISEMTDWGWEIASHGHRHSALIINSIVRPADKGDNELYLNNPGLITEGYEYKIYHRDKGLQEDFKVEELIPGKGVKISPDLAASYPAENTFIKPNERSLFTEIIYSQEILTERGYQIDFFVYPYNGFFQEVVEIVAEGYLAARAGHDHKKSFPEAFLNTEPFELYNLRGTSFDGDELQKDHITELIQAALDQRALLIFYGHPQRDEFNKEYLKHIIYQAEKLEVPIKSLSDIIYEERDILDILTE